METNKSNKFLIKSKKQMFTVIAVFTLLLFVGGTTYAFFNYTRTGLANTVNVGRISFTSSQTSGSENKIALSNVFPIDSSKVSTDTDNVGTLEITVTGDTDYSGGIEYLISSTNTNVTTSTGKLVPLSLQLDVSNLGTSNTNYFTARDNATTSIYKKVIGDQLVGDQMLLVGFIVPNTTQGVVSSGINGTITIKAYLDDDNILISDTIQDGDIQVPNTINGTNPGNKTVLTTSEWNSLSSTPLSFKVKVEAREGIWVNGSLEEIMRKTAVMDNINSTNVNNTTPGIDFTQISSDTNGNGVYIRAGTENNAYPIMYYRGDVSDNNVLFANKCWKAVRTTDTGGVKLIYNGEPRRAYEDVIQELSNYTNVNKITDVADESEPFTFDSNDNTWNIELTGASSTELEFTVPNGDNYIMEMTGTSGSSCGGQYVVDKDGSSVNGGSNGGGGAMNLTHEFGTLTDTDKIKMTYNGTSSTSCPITFKIKMKQNLSILSENQYSLISNGITSSQKWTFDNNEKEWYTIVPNNSSTKISFRLAKTGNYILKYTATGGPIKVKKGENILIGDNGTDVTINLENVLTSDEYSVEYQQMAPGSGKIEFSLIVQNDLGMVCDNTGEDSQLTEMSSYQPQETSISLAHMGYSYGAEYEIKYGYGGEYYYGSSFTYQNGRYHLINEQNTMDSTHHYSCSSENIGSTCENIDYIFSGDDRNRFYITLSNGKSIEEAIEEMKGYGGTLQNGLLHISPIQETINNWYINNLNGKYDKYIEDTNWCNDRSMTNLYGLSPNGNYNGNMFFDSYNRNIPKLTCDDVNDRLSKLNKKITFPIALLTSDEILLAGGQRGSNKTNSNYYLYDGKGYWLLSPYSLSLAAYLGEPLIMARNAAVSSTGSIRSESISTSYSIRPSISIIPGLSISSGTGTVLDPYVIL